MKFCPKCGTQLSDEALFCKKCGAEQKVPETEIEIKTEIQAEAPTDVLTETLTKPQIESDVNNGQSEDVSAAEKKTSSNCKKWIIIAIAAIAAAVMLFFAKGKNKIVGTWQDDYGWTELTFNKDGTCSMGSLGTNVNGTYKIDGNTIKMQIEGFTISFDYEINQDQMTLYETGNNNGTVYHRVKDTDKVSKQVQQETTKEQITAANTNNFEISVGGK